MRGAPTPKHGYAHAVGIIPADAGSTHDCGREAGRFEDHPRGCGEHHAQYLTPWIGSGSSPRMRGARKVKTGDFEQIWIIPADAGSTRGQSQ